MYGKMFEQAESFFKPMNDILALNVEVFETLKTKQSDLVNEVVADSVEFAKGMTNSNLNIDSMITTQQEFWEGLGTKIANNTQDNIELISGIQGKVGDLFKGAVNSNEIAPVALEAKPKPTPKKKAPAKKTTPKVEKPE